MTAATTGSELAFAGMAAQAELVRDGAVAARELVELYLERIFRLDQRLNAFRVVFADQALAEADQADARRGAGDDRPLLGVPIAVKDDMDVGGEITTYGTTAHGAAPGADSEVVRRLRAAGAIVIGKTNVPELMITPWTETPAHGITRNPWNSERTPGGSSGGSAAAVAAGLCAAATGSDGGGSIRIPAASCGLVGLKTQRGRVPTAPAAHHWHGMSVFGAVTRSVRDTALFYDVVKDSGPSFQEAAERDPGRLRIGLSLKVPKPVVAKADESQRRAMHALADRLRALGHEVVEREPDYGTVLYAVLARYLRGIRDQARDLPHPERLGPTTRGFVRMGGLVPDAALRWAIGSEASHSRRFNAIFEQDVDLLLTPVWTETPVRVGRWPQGIPAPWVLNREAAATPYPSIANYTGQPAMAVPTGETADGLPVGAQFVAPADGEPLLLSLAAQLERELEWPAQRPPLAA